MTPQISTIDTHQLFANQAAKALQLRTSTVKERRYTLKKLETGILKHRKEIQKALWEDLKKSPEETDISEILPVLLELREARAKLGHWMRGKRVPSGLLYFGAKARVVPEPKGRTLIISPWNYPFNLAVGPLVSAIAAGNTAILKPSEYTPATSSVINKLVGLIFDADEIQVVEGDQKIAQSLLELPFDHIFFTGSPTVGKIVMEQAAKHLTSVTLELGGKSPVVVDKSANIQDAAEKIAWGKWLNAGQTCVAPDYIFVHKEVAEPLTEKIEEAYKKYYSEKYTSIVSERHFDRMVTMLEDAFSTGAKVTLLGDMDRKTRKFPPAILLMPSLESRAMQEEIFGPILPIITYSDLNETIDYINANENPLALYVFGNHAVGKRLQLVTTSGTMCINECVIHFGLGALPFGGTGNSGFGKAHGQAGFLAFSNEKSILTQRIGFTSAKLLYPPYTKLTTKLINFLLHYGR